MVRAEYLVMKVFAISLHGVIAGTLVATAAPAFADYKVTDNESSNDERKGLVLGGSLDAGVIGCQAKSDIDCAHGARPAGGLSVHVGAMVTPTVAILGEASAMVHTQHSLTETQLFATANMRAWLTSRLWLQGGLGVARSKLSFDTGKYGVSVETATEPAITAAVGFELVRRRTFGLDLELRAGSGLTRDDVRIRNAALGFGLTFF